MPTHRPQPWYAAFNQPPKGNPKHGRNRKPTPPAHGDPIDRTSGGAGVYAYPGLTAGLPRTTWRTLNATTIYPSTGGVDYLNATQAIDLKTYTQLVLVPAFAEPTPPSIPYAGVRAGEITGYRMWLVLSSLRLCSLAHKFIWEPGATIEGDVDELVSSTYDMVNLYGGVYSYATFEELAPELSEIAEDSFPGGHEFGVAIGTIKCWGEVIEHQRGYRAQYAKLTSIDAVIGQVNLTALRQRYLP